jgi:transposase
MARELVDDELWEAVRPLLPPPPPHKTPAERRRLDDRRVFTGILFVLQAGLPWDLLPQEMGCGRYPKRGIEQRHAGLVDQDGMSLPVTTPDPSN